MMWWWNERGQGVGNVGVPARVVWIEVVDFGDAPIAAANRAPMPVPETDGPALRTAEQTARSPEVEDFAFAGDHDSVKPCVAGQLANRLAP